MSVTRLSRIRQALATFVLGYMLYLRPLAAELLPLRHVANPAPLAPGPSCTDANNSAYNPHRSPHEPGSPDPWFEGWYVRVTAEDGASSFAVGIGHFPEQQGILPHSAAACFLLASGPGEQLRLYSARFDNISVLTPSTSTTSTTTTTTTTTTRSRETSDPPYPPVDFALVATDNGTAHTDQEHRDADAAGAGHAHALSQHNYCVWNLTQQRLQISARLQGASVRIRLDRGGGGRCTAASPWSPQAASTGPEGWLSQWGFLLKLEYDVLSLRTPVQYVIREPGGDVVRQGDGGGARDTGAGVHGEGQEGAAGEVPMLLPSDDRGDGYEMGVSAGQRMLTAMQAGAQAEGAAGSASAAEQGQRGQQQDEEAKGAEGADSTLPRQWSSGWAHLEKNWGASFPDEWVWAQGHKHGPSCQEASFVLAGGMLPHVLEPLVPAVRQFVLSYHPPGGRPPVTMDPWDPPVLSSLEVQGCQGVLVVELYSPFKIGRVVARAPASTFQAVPCPTNDGFRNFSVESFAAHVELSIWARPFPFAPASASRLLYEDEFESAALEFGGAYVCPEGMPQLNSLEM